MKNNENAEIVPSNGNVFEDLGLENAPDRLAKAEVGRQIAAIIRARRQSQKTIASVLSIDQPKVSALLSGRLAGFSLERLTYFLRILGKDVEIAITDKSPSQETGQLTIGPLPEPLFQVGRLVQLRADPSRSGPIIDLLAPAGGRSRYRVFHSPTDIREYHEEQILPLENSLGAEAQRQMARGLDADTFRACLTASRLSHSLVDTLYSWQAARIQSIPFQFKPLLRFLRADQPRLLIADEVGVGKTIEAGLILKELEARGTVGNTLVVCPKSLTTKWRTEMRRFDEDFQVLTPQTLDYCLRETQLDGVWPQQYARAIAPLELLRVERYLRGVTGSGGPRPGLLTLTPSPQFSLLVVDEAHHLRNPETSSHELAAFLCDSSEAILFLSATPVHTGSRNLYALLKLLRPDLFLDESVMHEMLAPAPAITRAMRVIRAHAAGTWPTEAAAALDEAASTQWGRQVFERDPRFVEWRGRLHAETLLEDAERIRCLRDLEDVQPLAHIMNRTRRRDIGRFTIREPHTISVPFTPQQADFYRELLAFRRDVLLLTYDPRIVRLITDTLERQAASCLPALVPALDAFLRTGSFSAGSITDDPDDLTDQSDFTLPTDLAERARDLRRLAAELPTDDPKLASFLAVAAAAVPPGGAGPQSSGKLLVFSFFLHTLDYLERHLQSNGYRVGLITGRLLDAERDILRDRFGLPPDHSDALDVLLSSEVGCEGLDYQFCDKMVNYDIPWNPMRVEQRIGRIDRYGQKSDKIQIFNFITPGTVEERIFFRCFERLNVFRDTVGDLEEVLGDVAQGLSRVAFDPSLTPDQAVEKALQLTDNALRFIEEERRLEEEGGALLGLDHQFAEEVDSLVSEGGFVSADELRQMVARFFEQPPFRARFGPDERSPSILRLRMARDGRLALLERVRSLRRVDRSITTLVRWLQSDEPFFELTFDQATAIDMRDLPFITPVHPLARVAATSWHATSGVVSARLKVTDDALPTGHYVFICDLWETIAVRPEVRLTGLAWDVKSERHAPAVSEALLALLKRARSHPDEADVSSVDPLIIERGTRDLEEAAHDARLGALQLLRNRNETLVMQRLTSLSSYYQQRIARVESELSSARDTLIQRMKEGEKARIEVDYARKRGDIEGRRMADIISQRIAFGSLEIVAETDKGPAHAG